MRCQCKTSKGTRCKNKVKGSGNFCGVHKNCISPIVYAASSSQASSSVRDRGTSGSGKVLYAVVFVEDNYIESPRVFSSWNKMVRAGREALNRMFESDAYKKLEREQSRGRISISDVYDLYDEVENIEKRFSEDTKSPLLTHEGYNYNIEGASVSITAIKVE